MIVLIAAILLMIIFFVSGVRKVNNFDGVIGMVAEKLPAIDNETIYRIVAGLIVALEIIAPLIIVYAIYTRNNLDVARMALIALIAFTILATVLYYYPVTDDNMLSGMLHLALIGGLLALYAHLN